MAIYFFYGKEDFKISKDIEALKTKLVDKAFRTMNFKIFYSPSLEELLDICSAAPLMFGNLLTVIHMENYFFKGKNKLPDMEDNQLKALEYALKNVSESNNLIFVCIEPRNEEKKKIDARLKLFKTLAKYSNAKEYKQYREYDNELVSYISSMAKEKELLADTRTIKALIGYLGVNLSVINTELEKIKLAIYPNKKFTEKDILEYCSLQEDIFALSDLVISDDKNSIMENLEKVLERRHPLEIFGLLHKNLHKYIYLKTYEHKMTPKEFSNILKIPEYPVKLLLEKLQSKKLQELLQLKHRLTEAEVKIKTGQTQNPSILLEYTLLNGVKNV